MIISPKIIVESKILTNIQDLEDQVQQNGIDITLKFISKLNENSLNILTKSNRRHIERNVVIGKKDPELRQNEIIVLEKGIYDILFNEEIEVPNGICATIHTRSTLNRGGNFITTGLYDAGYKGVLGGILHVNIPIEIEIGVKLAQIVFHKADEGKMYDGIYNTNTIIAGEI